MYLSVERLGRTRDNASKRLFESYVITFRDVVVVVIMNMPTVPLMRGWELLVSLNTRSRRLHQFLHYVKFTNQFVPIPFSPEG